jgi:hypothetical protein
VQFYSLGFLISFGLVGQDTALKPSHVSYMNVVGHTARQFSARIKMEIIGFILIEFVFSTIGWVCLSIWYRDRKKIKKIRNEKYAGQYSGAGRVFVLNFIAGVGAIAMFGIVIVLLATWIYECLTN